MRERKRVVYDDGDEQVNGRWAGKGGKGKRCESERSVVAREGRRR